MPGARSSSEHETLAPEGAEHVPDVVITDNSSTYPDGYIYGLIETQLPDGKFSRDEFKLLHL